MFIKFLRKLTSTSQRGAMDLILIVVIVVILIGVGVYFFLSPKKEEITDPYLAAIKQSGKVVIGTDATYAPMEYTDENGKIVGFDIDIANKIAVDLGVTAEIKDYDWDILFDTVKNGEVDMIISSITITPERAETMSFSDPYFNAGQVIIVLEANTNIVKPKDLTGHKVGVQKETTSMEETKKYVAESLILGYEDYSTATDDLKSGKVEAVIIDYTAGLSLVQSTTGLKLANDPFTQEFYGIAVQKSDSRQVFLQKINNSIRKLKEAGTIKQLENKWLK